MLIPSIRADTRQLSADRRERLQVEMPHLRGLPTLRSLPLEPFRLYQYGERRDHLDGCVDTAAVSAMLDRLAITPLCFSSGDDR